MYTHAKQQLQMQMRTSRVFMYCNRSKWLFGGGSVEENHTSVGCMPMSPEQPEICLQLRHHLLAHNFLLPL